MSDPALANLRDEIIAQFGSIDEQLKAIEEQLAIAIANIRFESVDEQLKAIKEQFATIERVLRQHSMLPPDQD